MRPSQRSAKSSRKPGTRLRPSAKRRMNPGRITLDDMTQCETDPDLSRSDNDPQTEGVHDAAQITAKSRDAELSEIATSADFDDNASDTSDLISFSTLDVPGETSPWVDLDHEMSSSPTMKTDSGPGNDLNSALQSYDDPFSVAAWATPFHSTPSDIDALQEQLQSLQAAMRNLKMEKQVAEERADHATMRVEEMRELHRKAVEAASKGTKGTETDVAHIQEQNRLLKEQLNEAQSHIFSLQPYRKEMTPEELGGEYDELLEKVQDWVQKLMSPYLDDYETGIQRIMSRAKKNTGELQQFKRTLQAHPDLVRGSMYPESDEDIIVAIIMRHLHDAIFQKIVYGAVHHYTEVLSFVENHMQTSVEPKRDLFSVRNWTAEAYNALLSAPHFQKVRDDVQRKLTLGLAQKLRILSKRCDWESFCQSLSEECILPAMELYEKMQISTHHFYLDINPMIIWHRDGSLATCLDFYDSLHQLDCSNVLQNRKAFTVAKLDPPPTRKDLMDQVINVCTVAPALYMRRVGQRDAIKEPTVVRKQQTLVAWGPEETRQKFLDRGERTIASHLYFFRERWSPWD